MEIENKNLGHLLVKKMDRITDKCLSENTIAELIENKLTSDKKEEVFEHFNSCNECFEVYQMSLSVLNDGVDKKKEIIKPLSIAASIIFVFLIGFYYSNYYKSETNNAVTYQKKEPLLKVATDDGRSLDISSHQKKSGKKHLMKDKAPNKSVSEGISPPEEKKQNIEAEEVITLGDLKPKVLSENDKSEKRVSKTQEVERFEKNEYKDDEVSSVKPSVSLRVSQLGETEKGTNKKKRKGFSKKGIRSTFSKLTDQGFIDNNNNYFGKLSRTQIIKLLSEWKKILPDLTGNEKKIAKETIAYLQSIKQYKKNK